MAARALAVAAALIPCGTAAKIVQKTPVAEAYAEAAHVLVAEVVDDTLSALRPGERVAARHGSDRWEEFRIIRGARGGGEGLRPGDRIRIHDKSNSCTVSDTGYFIRPGGGGATEFRDDRRAAREVVTPEFAPGTPVVLFLDADRTHYGWFASPQALSPELERSLPGLAPSKRPPALPPRAGSSRGGAR